MREKSGGSGEGMMRVFGLEEHETVESEKGKEDGTVGKRQGEEI